MFLVGSSLEWDTTPTFFSTGGPAMTALSYPYSIYIPDFGDVLYIADTWNHRILRWPLNGTSSTIVAGGQGQGSNSMQLNTPSAVFVDKYGGILVTDEGNYRAQYFGNGSLIGRTVAGNGTQGSASTQIEDSIGGIALDSNNNVYISEDGNHRVSKWAPNATSGTTVAGDGTAGNIPSRLNSPTGLYLDPASNILYIASEWGHCIMKWVPGASTGSTVAGTCGVSGTNTTLLTKPKSVTFDKYGNMYVTDVSNSGRVICFSPGSMISTPIITSGLNIPMAVAFDKDLNLYVADSHNSRIVKYKLR